MNWWGIVNARNRVITDVLGQPALYRTKREAEAMLRDPISLYETKGLRVTRVTLTVSTSSERQAMTDDQAKVLLDALETLGNVSGESDMDAGCLRCARRMLAEVLGLPLDRYRLH
jgi:hypothetical protein